MEETNTNIKSYIFEPLEETKDDFNIYLERFEFAASINALPFYHERLAGNTPSELTYKDVVDNMSRKYGKHHNTVYERFNKYSTADDVIRHDEIALNSMKDAENIFTKTKHKNEKSYQNQVLLVSSKSTKQEITNNMDTDREGLLY
ncbi:hypothetical protein RF11_07524 [Thelohanellus kitauei]|uniref:Uncharacterized protein n=1 Tax=Thelohanellus kitauei TaxID=669202 RepID=A0A0C2IXM8_THEKT|nr:hypothetical protein RF11_07524 [Thelohanellus kitauei]